MNIAQELIKRQQIQENRERIEQKRNEIKNRLRNEYYLALNSNKSYTAWNIEYKRKETEFQELISDIYNKSDLTTVYNIVQSSMIDFNQLTEDFIDIKYDIKSFMFFEENMTIIIPKSNALTTNTEKLFSLNQLIIYINNYYESEFGYKYSNKKTFTLIDASSEFNYEDCSQRVRFIYEDEKGQRYGIGITVGELDEQVIDYILEGARNKLYKDHGRNIIIYDEDIEIRNIY